MDLTHYQTTNFRLFRTERVRRRQFHIWRKWQKAIKMGRKQCGKRRNCSLRAISPFSTVFAKDLLPTGRQTVSLCGNGLRIDLCGLTSFSTLFQWYLITNTMHNIISKPPVTFPHNHCGNNGRRWERTESCLNNYHQSSERLFDEPGIEPVISLSQVLYAFDWIIDFMEEPEKLVGWTSTHSHTMTPFDVSGKQAFSHSVFYPFG